MSISRVLGALALAGLSAISPVEGNGGAAHVIPNILFPDCHLCPAPRPEPRQTAQLAGVPDSYTPGERYDAALEVGSYGGPVARFALTVDRGTLEAVDAGARVVNYSEIAWASGVPVVRDFPMLTYTQPLVGPNSMSRFRWTAPSAGSGTAAFSFYVMGGQVNETGKGTWKFQQVLIPEASSPSPPASPAAPPTTPVTPKMAPAFPSPPPSETPLRSPGFGVFVALSALGLSLALNRKRRS